MSYLCQVIRLRHTTSPADMSAAIAWIFCWVADGKLTFAMGDVSGKRLPAALYMVGVLSTMRAHIVDGFSLDVVMAKLEQCVSPVLAGSFLESSLGRTRSRPRCVDVLQRRTCAPGGVQQGWWSRGV